MPVRYKLPPTWRLCNAGMQGVKLWAFLMAALCVCQCLLLSRSESPPLPLIRSMSPIPAMHQPKKKRVAVFSHLTRPLKAYFFFPPCKPMGLIAYCPSAHKVATVTKKKQQRRLKLLSFPVSVSKKKQQKKTTIVLLSLKSCLTDTFHSSWKLKSGRTS